MKFSFKKMEILLTLLWVLISAAGVAQKIHFTEAPEFYRLYPRDESNSARAFIKGSVEDPGQETMLSLKVYKNGVIFDQKSCPVKNSTFSLSSRIPAGLHQFRFELTLERDGRDSLCLVADSVVCGDAFIITGQSNSHASSSQSTYSSPYCRSFGVKTGYEPYTEADKKVRWGRATGNCPGLNGVGGWFQKNPYGVGVWGMELMRLIVEKHKIPVCIINGGSGSSSIEENMLYPEIPSLETSFGRLAYRVNQAGLKDHIKAILWHQGETNSNWQQDYDEPERNYRTYFHSFDILFNDWKRVYTGLEKVYLFQLHPGCGGNYQSEMREVQSRIARHYQMVDIMSTTGVKGHDGCHFSYEGYCEFAGRIFPLVSRDFYGEIPEYIITPPELIEACYAGDDVIELLFDQPVHVEEKHEIADGQVFWMKDQFFFREKNSGEEVSGVVEGLTVHDNRIILNVKNHTVYGQISWLPGKNYSGTETVYQGPWIWGKENNNGALTFHKRTVSR